MRGGGRQKHLISGPPTFNEWSFFKKVTVSMFGCVVQIWILAAQFEVRQLRMVEARKILGMSLGMCPKDRTYKAYIEVSCLISAAVFHHTAHTMCNQLGPASSVLPP